MLLKVKCCLSEDQVIVVTTDVKRLLGVYICSQIKPTHDENKQHTHIKRKFRFRNCVRNNLAQSFFIRTEKWHIVGLTEYPLICIVQLRKFSLFYTPPFHSVSFCFRFCPSFSCDFVVFLWSCCFSSPKKVDNYILTLMDHTVMLRQ